MAHTSLNEIYLHKLNFLIGSVASSGQLPILWLPVKNYDNPEKEGTIETLATKLVKHGEKYKHHHALLFMYYYKNIIEPVCKFQLSEVTKTHKDCKAEECETCKQTSAE
ncbi:hypothetical protein [Vibrio splendidus]|uniref:hypothetical protein n=1 Tax=Vibrio splendidus TaxID=29497 RepID=UPI0024697016|nr:hypothetical protein [Vibrio splendidus]MDH5886371.1 hypothetical protein [Vibrio splendidus]